MDVRPYAVRRTRKFPEKSSNPFLKFTCTFSGQESQPVKYKSLADLCGRDIGKLVDLVFSFEYKQKIRRSWVVRLKPLQVKSEIAELCRIVQESNPKTIVEIGSASGGTLFLFAHVAKS